MELAEAYFVAGVEAVQDDAGAGHAGSRDLTLGPLRVEHDPGGVVAVDQRRLLPGGLQGLVSADKELILLVCIRNVLGAVVIRHGEVLEQAGHMEAGQGASFQHFRNGLVEVGAERKADAAHTGVGLEVDVHLPARGHGGGAQRLGLRQGVTGGGDVVLDEGGGELRLHMAQDEDGQGPARPPQLHGLGKAADGQPHGPLLGEDAGALDRAVAVAVGLDDGAEGQTARPLLHGAEVGAQSVEVDLGPDVFFKIRCLHETFLQTRIRPQDRETLSTRFTISLMEASLVRPET